MWVFGAEVEMGGDGRGERGMGGGAEQAEWEEMRRGRGGACEGEGCFVEREGLGN